MSARSLIAIVSLLAVFACSGGPTSDFPFDTPMGSMQDAGARSPDDMNEPPLGGAGSAMDAGLDQEDQDAAAIALDAGSPSASPCGADASPDGGLSDGGDAAFDVDASDAAPAVDASDAAPSADADAAQIDADANFPDATSDAALSPADAASDAPYIGPDAAPCVP